MVVRAPKSKPSFESQFMVGVKGERRRGGFGESLERGGGGGERWFC